MNNIADVLWEVGKPCPSRSPGFNLVLSGVRVDHLLEFLCCFFLLFIFVLCLVYPMLSVSLDCLFLIAPSVFSDDFVLILRVSDEGYF